NRRSLLARRNLIDAIHLALASPVTKGETYLVADPAPLTLGEIVTALRAGEGRRPGLLPVPPALITLAASALGRVEEWQRLGGTLVVDPNKLLRAGWKPAPDTGANLAALASTTSPRNAH
ncbi:MAG: NAD-dependent dehydratase, partial [Pseudolabrys sp.]